MPPLQATTTLGPRGVKRLMLLENHPDIALGCNISLSNVTPFLLELFLDMRPPFTSFRLFSLCQSHTASSLVSTLIHTLSIFSLLFYTLSLSFFLSLSHTLSFYTRTLSPHARALSLSLSLSLSLAVSLSLCPLTTNSL